MARLQASYTSMTDVPSEYQSAYEEKDGAAVFVGGDFEFKTEAEFNEMQKAKQSGFDKYHSLKAEMSKRDEADKSRVNEIEMLRAQLKSGGDEETIKAIVETRVARETEELTKTNSELSNRLSELEGFKLKTEKKSLVNELIKEHISKDVRSDAEYMIGNAVERLADGSYVSNGELGFEKGIPVDKLVGKMIESRPHWKKQNVPGHGGNGSNGGTVASKRQQFQQLLVKAREGKLTRGENQLFSQLANEIKAETTGA